MAATKRDVEIALKARDAYSAEFDKLNKRISGIQHAGADGGFGQSATESLSRAVRAAGQVQAVINSITVLTATFRGDTEAALTAVKQLPFGLGSVATAFEGIIGQVIGLNEALAELNKAKAAEIEQKTFAANLNQTREQVAAINDQLRKQIELANASELDRPFVQIEQALDGTLSKLENLSKKLGTSEGAISIAIREAITQANRLADSQREELLRQRREESTAEARKRADELLAIDSELLQAQRRLVGDAVGAQIESIREGYRQRIAAAREANKIELADRLETLRDMDVAEVQRRAKAKQERPGGIPAFESRFLTRAPQSFFTEANSQEARRIAELKAEVARLKEVVDGAAASLETIVRDRTIIRVENN